MWREPENPLLLEGCGSNGDRKKDWVEEVVSTIKKKSSKATPETEVEQ